MAVFSYRALNDRGEESSGTLSAPSRTSALEAVAGRGLHPVDLRQEEGEARVGVVKAGRVSAGALEAFTRELANLLAGGVPLARALHILGRESSSPAASRVWSAIHDRVVDGVGLADAMAQHGRVFPPVYVAMVRAGEAGGFLEVVLNQIAEFQSREAELKGRVKSAMIYPAILAGLAVVVLVFLLTYFIPRFNTIFEDFGGSLPALTQVVVGASHVVRGYWPVALMGVVAGVVLMRRATRSEAGRRGVEQATLRTPGLGMVVSRFALVRFCRMLGTLLGSGVELVSALRVAREAIGHQSLSDAVGTAIEDVRSGQSLARSLARCPVLFPGAVVEMVAVAEETGRLDKELVRLANSYESELDRRLRMLVAMLEPLLLFVMAALIGTVVVSMLLPIFTLQELIG